MTRQILIVVGTALLSIGAIGIVAVLVWLTESQIHGTLPYIFDQHAEMLIYALPVLLLVIAIVGAAFVSGALAAHGKDQRSTRTLRPHTRLRA